MKKILQGFKQLFQKKRKKSTVYLCDPYRNRKCSREGCWPDGRKGPCQCTHNKNAAKRGDDGKPILATDDDMYNLDYWDYEVAQLLGTSEKSQKKQGL